VLPVGNDVLKGIVTIFDSKAVLLEYMLIPCGIMIVRSRFGYVAGS
jgi:hypothetical protein